MQSYDSQFSPLSSEGEGQGGEVPKWQSGYLQAIASKENHTIKDTYS
jgi:hypothetical protein